MDLAPTVIAVLLGLALPVIVVVASVRAGKLGNASEQAWQKATSMLKDSAFLNAGANGYALPGRVSGDTADGIWVTFDPLKGTLEGRVERPCPGGWLETFLGKSAELRPGESPPSEMAMVVVRLVGEMLARLPPAARLKVEAPKVPGAGFKARVETPLRHPAVADTVVRLLMNLDEAADRPVP
jgi:hypothetical protein